MYPRFRPAKARVEEQPEAGHFHETGLSGSKGPGESFANVAFQPVRVRGCAAGPVASLRVAFPSGGKAKTGCHIVTHEITYQDVQSSEQEIPSRVCSSRNSSIRGRESLPTISSKNAFWAIQAGKLGLLAPTAITSRGGHGDALPLPFVACQMPRMHGVGKKSFPPIHPRDDPRTLS